MAVNTKVHSPPRNKIVSWLVTQALNDNIRNTHHPRHLHNLHLQTLNFVEALGLHSTKKIKRKNNSGNLPAAGPLGLPSLPTFIGFSGRQIAQIRHYKGTFLKLITIRYSLFPVRPPGFCLSFFSFRLLPWPEKFHASKIPFPPSPILKNFSPWNLHFF